MQGDILPELCNPLHEQFRYFEKKAKGTHKICMEGNEHDCTSCGSNGFISTKRLVGCGSYWVRYMGMWAVRQVLCASLTGCVRRIYYSIFQLTVLKR